MSFRRESEPSWHVPASVGAALAPVGPLRSDAVQLRPDVQAAVSAANAARAPTKSVSLHAGPRFAPQYKTSMPLSTTLDLDAMFAAKATAMSQSGCCDELTGAEFAYEREDDMCATDGKEKGYLRQGADALGRGFVRGAGYVGGGAVRGAVKGAKATIRGAGAAVQGVRALPGKTRTALDAEAKKRSKLDKFDLMPFAIVPAVAVADGVAVVDAEKAQEEPEGGVAADVDAVNATEDGPGPVPAAVAQPAPVPLYKQCIIAAPHKVYQNGSFQIGEGKGLLDHPPFVMPFGVDGSRPVLLNETERRIQALNEKEGKQQTNGKDQKAEKTRQELSAQYKAQAARERCSNTRASLLQGGVVYPVAMARAASEQLALLRQNVRTSGATERDLNLSGILGYMMCVPHGQYPWGIDAATAVIIEDQLKQLSLTRGDINQGTRIKPDFPHMVEYGNKYPSSDASIKSITGFVALPLPPASRDDGGIDYLQTFADPPNRPSFEKHNCSEPDPSRAPPRDSSRPMMVPVTEENLRKGYSHVLYPVHVQTRAHDDATTPIKSADLPAVCWGGHPIFVPNDNVKFPNTAEFRNSMLGERTATAKYGSHTPSNDLFNYKVVVDNELRSLANMGQAFLDPPKEGKPRTDHFDLLLAWSAMTFGHGVNTLAAAKFAKSSNVTAALKEMLAATATGSSIVVDDVLDLPPL